MQAEIGHDKYDSEESKKELFPHHGMELWGIGYVSSDYEQDDDEDAEEEDADESEYNENLKRKIFTNTEAEEDFSMEEFEHISSNSRLREIYSYRWWKDHDQDNYFVMVCKHQEGIKAGQQIYYNYGRRSNAFLLEKYVCHACHIV